MTSVGGVKGNNQFSKRGKPEIEGVDIVTAGASVSVVQYAKVL